MWTIILSTVSYIYGFGLTALFFSKALQLRYSIKKSILLISGMAVFICIFKLPVLYAGMDINTNLLTGFQIGFVLLHLVFVYRGTVIHKVLALLLNMLTLSVAESFVMYLLRVNGIYGERALEAGATYTIIGTLIMIPLQVIACYVDCYIWNRFRNIRWQNNTHQFFCLLLPVGQIFFMEAMLQEDMVIMHKTTWLLFVGLLLSVATEIGVFELLERAEERNRLESELRQMQHYYDMEQIHYEQLRELQEQTARIRHDFQNHLLMLQNVEEHSS